MSTLLVRDGTIVTVDRERRILAGGSVLVENDRITRVGFADGSWAQADKVIDAKGKMVLPGFVDTHLHSMQALARGLGDDVEALDWLNRVHYGYEKTVSAEEAYVSSLLSCLEKIRTGTTCFCDPGGYHMDGVARAVGESGLRAVISQRTADQELPVGWPQDRRQQESLEAGLRLVDAWHGKYGGRLRGSISLRGETETSADLFRQIRASVDRSNVLIQMPAGIQFRSEKLRAQVGMGTLEYLAHLGVLSANWLLIHCVWLSDADLKIMKEYDAKVSHNPGASLHLALGACTVGRFAEMIDLGITVALGTDAMPSNNSLDMVRAMYLAAHVHKEAKQRMDIIPPEKALEMATIDAARALLWDDEIGSIEVGKKADLIILDMQRANWVPVHDFSIVPNLVYAADGGDVETTIVDGKILMEDRQFTTLDVDYLLQRGQQVAKDVVDRLPYTIAPRWRVIRA